MDRNENKKYVIWGNIDMNEDGWRSDFEEYLEANEIEMDPDDKTAYDIALENYINDSNNLFLDDQRENLDIQLSKPIIVIADLGRWNGRKSGYKLINSCNIKDCLYDESDYVEWYVDDKDDMRAIAMHHDGTNYYLYRVFKDTATEEDIENLKDKIYYGTATQEDIDTVTDRLGDKINI